MPSRIFKYKLANLGTQTVIPYPAGLTVMSCGLDAERNLCIWARVPEPSKDVRVASQQWVSQRSFDVTVVGTGDVYPDNLQFLGTVANEDTGLVLHVFIPKEIVKQT